MSPSKTSVASGDKIELYDKLIATNPKIERRGDNNPYTALNGNMFTLLGMTSQDQENAQILRVEEPKAALRMTAPAVSSSHFRRQKAANPP